MGHVISYTVIAKGKTEKEDKSNRCKLLSEISNEAEHEDWEEGGGYETSQMHWHPDTMYKCREDAEDAIRELDNGWYDDHAVLFHDVDSVKPSKKMETIQSRMESINKKQADYISKNHIKNHKSKFITCPKCGSKVNVEYVDTYYDQCPVCGCDLRSDTVKQTIERYAERINECKDQLRTEKKKLASKAPVCWLVKYEYHV